MRRQLTVTLLSLTGLLLVAFGLPLGYVLAMNSYHHFAAARLNETVRLAAAAAPVLVGGTGIREFTDRISRYDDTTGVAVLLVDANGSAVSASRTGLTIDRVAWQNTLRRALAGERSNIFEYEYNVSAEPLFIAEPVEDDGEVIGAVASISPTEALSRQIGQELAVFAGAGLLGLLAAAAASIMLSRWIMRPIHRLIRTARLIGQGNLDPRAPDASGPPEVRELARTFNRMADRLITALHIQRSFVADASHQLRNPLAAMRLRVETLEPFIAEHGQQQFQVALGEVERLSRILDELLQLAHAESRTVSPVRVDVADVAGRRAEAWRPMADQRGVEVKSACRSLFAAAAPGTLDQVLDVLIDNAVEVAPAGTTISVTSKSEAGMVAVHVVDQGPGMSLEDRARAVDRFWRGRASAGREGSGLGLAIAVALLHASHGRMRLDEAPGGGLDAVAVLPVWPADGSDRGADRTQHSSGRIG